MKARHILLILLVMAAIVGVLRLLGQTADRFNRDTCGTLLRDFGRLNRIGEVETADMGTSGLTAVPVCPHDESGEGAQWVRSTVRPSARIAGSFAFTPESPVIGPNGEVIILYENPKNHGKHGTNVMYRDGSVAVLPARQAEELLLGGKRAGE